MLEQASSYAQWCEEKKRGGDGNRDNVIEDQPMNVCSSVKQKDNEKHGESETSKNVLKNLSEKKENTPDAFRNVKKWAHVIRKQLIARICSKTVHCRIGTLRKIDNYSVLDNKTKIRKGIGSVVLR